MDGDDEHRLHLARKHPPTRLLMDLQGMPVPPWEMSPNWCRYLNLIAQKIQSNIEKLQYSVTNSKKTYVLFLPDNEIHELGLLYLNYELVLRGNNTIYLGQSLPLDNLNYFFEGAVRTYTADFEVKYKNQ